MATWGSQTWGYYNWGTLGDASITVSGQSTLSLSVGSVQVQQVPGWGTQYWGAGEWGDLVSPEVALTGQQLNTNLDQVTISANADVTINTTSPNIELNSIVGDEVAGTSAEVNPLGEELNSTVNSVFAGELVTVPVTSASNEAWGENAWSVGAWGVGDGQTLSVGDTSVAIGQQIDAQGQELTTSVNDVLAGISIIAEPAGEELTPDLGSLSFESKYLIGSAQADTDIGNASVLANADVTLTSPDALSISEGIVDPAPDAMIIGVGMTITSGVGTVTAGANIGTTGVEAVVTTNAVSITADANIDTTGSQITGNTGQLEYEAIYSFDGSQANITAGDAFGGEVVEVQVTTASAQPWGELAWGEGQWGQSVGTDIAIGADAVLTPSIDVPVTGEQLDWTIGNETVTGDANVTLTGNEVTTALGDEDAFTKVTVQVTGQQLTSSVSNVLAGISQLVTPTGVTATTNVGTMGINAWAVIEPNASTTWSVVDKAAA